MQKKCRVLVNGQEFTAQRGEVLLDAALVNGIEIPHDCRSGHCGTCQVRVQRGLTIGGDSDGGGMVRACQARVITDLELLVEPVPDVVTTRGTITALRPLAPDIVEVKIALAKPVSYLPGQYYKVQFRGYPARCFSPTASMTATAEDQSLRFHIRQVPDGRVSSALGKQILKGHGVKLEGPFGSAYFRPALNKRLILISSGTGFAPVWSIANAAIKENPRRHIVLIVSAREHISLYMGPAIRRLKYLPNIAVIPVVDATQGASGALRTGRPTAHIPALRHSDVVYACGGPKMVDAAKAVALAAGADFYADPFIPQSDGSDDNVFTKAIERLSNLMSLTDGTKRSSRPLEIEDLRPQLEIPPENLPQGGAKLQLLAQLTISTNHVDISPESLRARRAERRRRA